MRILKPLPGILPMPGRPLADAVALLPMNSLGNKVFDLSGNNLTANITGNVSWNAGRIGFALLFAGGDDDYISLQAMNVSQAPCSICIWIYFTGGDEISYIFDHFNPRFVGYLFEKEIRFFHDALMNSGFFVTNNLWYQLVFTFNNTGFYNLYVNGVLVYGADTNLTPADIFSGIFYIGTKNDTSSGWSGLLDVPIIYNYELFASEVALLYKDSFCMFPENIMPEFGIIA